MEVCVCVCFPIFYPGIWPRKSLDQLTKESQMSVQKDMIVMLMLLLVTQALRPLTTDDLTTDIRINNYHLFNPAMHVEA